MSDNPQDDEKRTIRAGRRRPSTEQSGPRERAEAPRRQRDEGATGQPPPASSQRPATTSVPRTSGGKPNTLLIIVGIIVLAVIFFRGGGSLFGPTDTETGVDAPAQQAAVQIPTAAPTRAPAATKPAAAAASSADGGNWLVMLYQDADDKVLEQDIYVDLNEAERVGSSDRVQIVAQIDRYRAGYQGDGDWSEARRYFVTQDDDLERLGSEVVEELGEVNMADAATLTDFVTWAMTTYPADHHVLILSDHGMGWPGGWSDTDSRRAGDRSIPLSAALGDQIFLMELDEALGTIRSQTGIDKLDLVGMDACLMSHLEVYDALAPHARIAVASQETEPALGWAYASFLQSLVENPDMDAAQLGHLIVESYIDEDERIVDDSARADLMRQGSGMSGMYGLFEPPSAEAVAAQMGRGVTLTAVDLAAIPAVIDRLNSLTLALQEVGQPNVAKARSYAQSFTSIFGSQVPASYIDLGHFAGLLKRAVMDPDVASAVDDLLAAIGQSVLAEKHGADKPGATGISVYFPTSQVFNTREAGPPSYFALAERFAADSLWDDFLVYHYTGRSFDEGAVATAASVPSRSVVAAPGAGQIEVSPLQLSSDTAAPGQPVLLSADISGGPIGYIYLFAGFVDTASKSIFVADMDYLDSGDTQELQGVYYPDWGEGDFTLEFEWEPLMFEVTDGDTSTLALLEPENYGATPADAIYSAAGVYTYADGESRVAKLQFADGALQQVLGFSGEDGTGAPREIVPSPGDSITILEQWMDLNEQGAVTGQATQPGATLTFNQQTLTWRELDAAVGTYVVGLIVEDLDGNRTARYAPVTVE